MNDYPNRRVGPARPLTREEAELLLSGRRSTEAQPDALAALLDQLRPAIGDRVIEAPRESEAIAAFVAAGADPSAVPPSRRRSGLSRALTVKVTALALLLAGGGTALAAVGLPKASKTVHTIRGSVGSSAQPHRSGAAGVVSPSATAHRGGPEPAGAPIPHEVDGLCKAYEDLLPNARVKALETLPLSALVSAAGGAGNVDAYCKESSSDGYGVSPSPVGLSHMPNSHSSGHLPSSGHPPLPSNQTLR